MVLATASRGEAIVLGALLVVLELGPATAIAVGGALVASSWRWGSTSLEALAGAQAVLGPAGSVGPTSAAAGAWLGAAALVLALGRWPDPVRAVPAGVAVAAVLAGPAPGGDLPVRAVAAVAAAVATYCVGWARVDRDLLDRALAVLAAAAGVAAVVAVGAEAPDWPPVAHLADVWEGAALAAGSGLAALVAQHVVARAPWRPREAASNVDQPGPPPAHLPHR